MFYTSVKYSKTPYSLNNLDLMHQLQIEEQRLEFEQSKLMKYLNIENSLEIQVKCLTKDFLKSESYFSQSKANLSITKAITKPDYISTSLYEMLNFSPSESKSLKKALSSFTYASLTDEDIEKLLPIWKNRPTSNLSQEIFNFIGASLECKMKSDLLNSASDRLSRIINKIEGIKLNTKKIEGNIEEIHSKLEQVTRDENGLTGKNLKFFKHDQNFLIKSEDLYGLDYEKGNSSTIIYQTDENLCETCKCVPF